MLQFCCWFSAGIECGFVADSAAVVRIVYLGEFHLVNFNFSVSRLILLLNMFWFLFSCSSNSHFEIFMDNENDKNNTKTFGTQLYDGDFFQGQGRARWQYRPKSERNFQLLFSCLLLLILWFYSHRLTDHLCWLFFSAYLHIFLVSLDFVDFWCADGKQKN